jgi:hypothetical protein
MTSSDISKDPRIDRSLMNTPVSRDIAASDKGQGTRHRGILSAQLQPPCLYPEEENILSSIGDMTGIAVEAYVFREMRELYEFQRRGVKRSIPSCFPSLRNWELQ